MFKLLSTSGDQSIELAPGRTLVVGRAVTSDVPIYDPTISRRHAEITLVTGGVRVKDLGSSNGTFLNGARITQADAGANDVVTFGKVAFKVAGITPPVRPSAPSPEVGTTGGSRAMPQGTIVRQLPVSPSSGGVKAIALETGPAAVGASHLKVKAENETERREKKLELLLEISKELSRQQELDQLLHKVVDVTFQIMNVDRVSILLLDPRTKELVPKVSRSRTGEKLSMACNWAAARSISPSASHSPARNKPVRGSSLPSESAVSRSLRASASLCSCRVNHTRVWGRGTATTMMDLAPGRLSGGVKTK